MLQKLIATPTAKLALGVGTGIFGGLMAYRIAMWLPDWWEGLSYDSKETISIWGIYVAILTVIFFFIRRSLKKKEQTWKQSSIFKSDASGRVSDFYVRHRTTIKSVCFTGAFGVGLPLTLFVIGLIYRGATGKL